MENKLFLFRIDYHHYRTGEPTSVKIGIIKAKNKEAAKELIWQDYGNDYATLKDYNIADVTNMNYATIEVHYPKSNHF